MCGVCEGTHVVAGKGTVGMYILACPTCGPMPAEIKVRKDEVFWARVREAEKRIAAS